MLFACGYVYLTGGKFTIYQSIILYRKFSADYIFTGNEFLQKHVLITDAGGVVMDVVKEDEAGDGVERFTGILCPGFINSHCHLELSHMKGLISRHSGLVDFVLKVVNERHSKEEQVLSAIANAENEMLQNGIVAVGDICNNILTIPQKKKNKLCYHNFIETSGFPPAVAEQRFNRGIDIYNSYASSFSSNSIVPHAPYSVSEAMFQMINEFPGNSLLTIHNQEAEAENELFMNKTGELLMMYEKMGIDISFFKPSRKTSLQTWLPYFTKAQTIILVHDVCTSEADLVFINRLMNASPQKHFFCLCPNANLYISNKLPDVRMLLQHGCDVVLGTDSLASNDQLSILEEMKTLQKNFEELDLALLLKWATINGSRALNMDEISGSFAQGKKPGVVLIENAENLHLHRGTSAKRIL